MVPEGVNVRKVDLGQELQILAYHEQRKNEDSQPAYAHEEELVDEHSGGERLPQVDVGRRTWPSLPWTPRSAAKLADAAADQRAHRRGRGPGHLQPHRDLRLGVPLPRRAWPTPRDALADLAGSGHHDLQSRCAVYFDEGAVAHTFAVAAGLDSVVIGESQILGQVKNALTAAQANGTVGTALNALFQQALRVGKRVQAETGIGSAGRSLVSVAYRLLTDERGPLAGRRVLVVGAGADGRAGRPHRRGGRRRGDLREPHPGPRPSCWPTP